MTNPSLNTLEQFEIQKKRHASLHQQRTRVEALRDAEQETLLRVRKEAIELFGTDDLAELSQLLESAKQENLQKTETLTKNLNDLESALQAIDQVSRNYASV